ncbi:MarC family protein [Rhodoblastus sp.]|uniref:MarC family protein n=1 Tax=Rhodoblastus sp. TaxID=1962975 RepID=UPI002636B547|nr:MarC family protein [Rhodoblastus sp.]
MFEMLKAAFVTLLVTIDPPGVAPVFLALTAGMSAQAQREVALRAAAIAFAVLLLFALGGRPVLNLLGISMAAFRIAGGLLLFRIAVEMIFGREERNKQVFADEAVSRDHISNIAAFPLAIPLLAGPGSITATILLAERAENDWSLLFALAGVTALIMAITFFAFIFAGWFARLLGVTGQVVLSRMLGVILAALAAQFVIDGVMMVVGSRNLAG